MKNKEIGKLQKRISKLRLISNIVVLIGAVIVTIFMKLNFITSAVITALITFIAAFSFDVVRKVFNMILGKANKNKDESTN